MEWVIVALSVICIISAVVIIRSSSFDPSAGEGVFLFVGLVSAVALLTSLILIPICRIHAGAKIATIEATREAVAVVRQNDNLEQAAVHIPINEANKEIALMQHWNRNGFDLYWPDEVDQLEPLR